MIVTIQKTSKRWKKIYLISFLAISIGLVTLFISMSINSDAFAILGILLTLSGVIGFIVAKIGAWWTNR